MALRPVPCLPPAGRAGRRYHAAMTTTLKIDLVSDVACPWCAVGLASLETALQRLAGEIEVQLRLEPFELNPQMGPEGQDIDEHLAQKYGSTPEQRAANWEQLRQRGEAVGFSFRPAGRGRVWNTFDAHRLLHWAGLQSDAAQVALKKALLGAYFTEGRNVSDAEVLLDAVRAAGLDAEAAAAVLRDGLYADEVRAREQHWQSLGIRVVPSFVIQDRHLLQGGQPPELFEQALRQLAAQAA
jgi:predicted DsbA family dithiol-disulfide isomerase